TKKSTSIEAEMLK
ncbi:hypothetical protein MIMGU_mgv1a0055671mg, partial [Erythranthe guttata]